MRTKRMGGLRSISISTKSSFNSSVCVRLVRCATTSYSREFYRRSAKYASVNMAITSKRLARAGHFRLSDRYESLHLCD